MVFFIEYIPIPKATGLLKRLFDKALNQAGRVARVVHVMSVNPPVMEAAMGLYGNVMFGTSPLSRSQREMMAVVVSKTNHCLY